ncbi:hypothetical protein BDY21DRAFT_3 [Lineolata rhizophorae]|uniref:F-box domain-containing protein n=1 Tax=Lineolata rhizophorae TaxID=578093 RepID=A0A6A6PCQ4_9PEZI|nr:hypothetical protein BDY21DRAFT_3 [Lineolata rhizophorae]
MTSETVTSSARPPVLLPSLPPEIWVRILKSHNQPGHLWNKCRQVSRSFRDWVDQVFLEKQQLQKVSIDFHFSAALSSRTGFEHPLALKMTLDRLSEDKTGAIFKHRTTTEIWGDDQEMVSTMKDKARNTFRGYQTGHLIQRPRHVIKVRRSALDSDLPDLQFDYQTVEISFDWRKMFTDFYAEVAYCERLRIERLNTIIPEAARQRELIGLGLCDPTKSMMEMMNAFADIVHDATKDARRFRIRKLLLDRFGEETSESWDPDDEPGIENKALEELKEINFALGFATFDDLESGGVIRP